MSAGTDQVLGARYRLTERIAAGGMGEVWAAEDIVLGREVAVKILRREYADDPTFLERFRAEARHTAALSHPGIAAVYDFAEGSGARAGLEGSPYLVMERVPGEPLSALVSREGTLTPARTLDVVGQAALGLQAAHDAGVVHRDVKPGNILVTPEGVVKVTDFGIARATNSVPLTRTGAIMGTAYYISPEQASGASVTPASDVYSLGVVAYECLTGRRPFDGDTPVSVALAQVSREPPALPEDLPEAVRALVMRMLAKDPARRPGSAGELGREALALSAAVAGAPAVTRLLEQVPDPGPSAGGSGAPRPSTDTDPGFRLPEPAARPGWWPLAALAVVALLVVALVRGCGGGGSAAAPGALAARSGPTRPTSVQVAPADLLGRPEAEVRAELVGLGVRPAVRRSAGGGVVGTVKHVAPAGTVAAGTTVTLDVVAAPSRRPPGVGHPETKPGKGHGRKKDHE